MLLVVFLRHSLFLRNRLSICGVNVWSNMLENQLLVSGRQHAAGGGGGPMVQVTHRAKIRQLTIERGSSKSRFGGSKRLYCTGCSGRLRIGYHHVTKGVF